MSEKIKDGGPAFPNGPFHYGEDGRILHSRAEQIGTGMSLRAYLMAHAPDEPQDWFAPVMPDIAPLPKYGCDPSWGFSEDDATLAESWRKDPCYDLDEKPRHDGDGRGGARFEKFCTIWRGYWECERNFRNERARQRYIQWPAAWADAQLAQLVKETA